MATDQLCIVRVYPGGIEDEHFALRYGRVVPIKQATIYQDPFRATEALNGYKRKVERHGFAPPRCMVEPFSQVRSLMGR